MDDLYADPNFVIPLSNNKESNNKSGNEESKCIKDEFFVKHNKIKNSNLPYYVYDRRKLLQKKASYNNKKTCAKITS